MSVDILSRLSPGERRALNALSDETGFTPEALAAEMAAAYVRLLLDAPKSLPDRPLLRLVGRAGREARRG